MQIICIKFDVNIIHKNLYIIVMREDIVVLFLFYSYGAVVSINGGAEKIRPCINWCVWI